MLNHQIDSLMVACCEYRLKPVPETAMKAVVINRYGENDVVEIKDVPVPIPVQDDESAERAGEALKHDHGASACCQSVL